MREVDLRSDTVTKPTPEMREAMVSAEVGDDVFGEDPTVNELQKRVADLCGKEAALFVPTGSMGNLVSLRSLAQPGDEVLCHVDAHFIHYEVASVAAVAGILPRGLPGHRGVIDPEALADAVHPPMYTFPRSAVVAIENTHNMAGGAVYPLEAIKETKSIADNNGMKLHIDGARIFNASVAAGVAVSEYAALADGLTFCFSKGLGCPVGSIVVGDESFIESAHRYRKMHGGGMRQAGILAAAALIALDTMVERLAEDHANAKALGRGIAEIDPDAVKLDDVETNMVVVSTGPLGYPEPASLVGTLGDKGVKFLPQGVGKVRLVTHNDVSAEDIDFAIEQFRAVAT